MIKLITHSDIGCDEVQNVITDELNKYDKFVFLTATMNLKIIRAFSHLLQKVFEGTDSESPNLLTFTEFIQSI